MQKIKIKKKTDSEIKYSEKIKIVLKTKTSQMGEKFVKKNKQN